MLSEQLQKTAVIRVQESRTESSGLVATKAGCRDCEIGDGGVYGISI